MKFVKAYVFEGQLMQCVLVMQQITKYRDLLFYNKICIEHVGETMMFYKQDLRSYSSGYNEIVYRTEVININNAGDISTDSEF